MSMYVVENGVTGEWVEWFTTEALAFDKVRSLELINENLKGHHVVRESIK